MPSFSRLFKFRIFRFRPTLTEELEDLHNESLHLQQTLMKTRLLERTWTKRSAMYGIMVYSASNFIYFTMFLSHDYIIRIYTVIISLLVGILLYGVYGLICWYFRTVIHMKEDRLVLFNDRKQELIEEVKKKETYSVAKNLLEKYDDKIRSDNRSPSLPHNDRRDLRQRRVARPIMPGSSKSSATVESPNIGTLEAINSQILVSDGSNCINASPTADKLPRTAVSQQRSFLGRVFDVISGAGPSKRYALICKSCNSHNGMALEEEFEHLTFRCAYCNYLNSAPKKKSIVHNNTIIHGTQATKISQSTNESTAEHMERCSSQLDHSDENHAPKDTVCNGTRRSISVETQPKHHSPCEEG